MDDEALQQAVDGWLAAGPLTIEELAERVVNAEAPSADMPAGVQAGLDEDNGLDEDVNDADEEALLDAIEWLVESSDAYWTAYSETDHEVIVLASTFTDTGMTFTHRATEEELASGALTLAPDLSVIAWNRRRGLALDDGTGPVVVEYSTGSAAALAGPVDWIEAVRPGDLLAFTRTDGELSVEVIAEADLADGAAEIEALREAAARWIDDGHGEEEVPVVMEALARNPKLFRRPVRPVGELLVAAGLEQRDREWGWAGEEWQPRSVRSTAQDAAIRRLYGFDRCCDRAFDAVNEAYDSYFSRRVGARTDGRADDTGSASDTGWGIDPRALADDLRHGSVTPAFVHANALAPEAVARFALAAANAAHGRHVAPAMTLLGLAHLRMGDPEAAVEALEAALLADPDFPVAAGTLAELELDRGNLARAHTLAVRDGADPAFVEWMESERARQQSLRPSAARNDPCPCGSGKKFKRCCANGGALTLSQRIPLVLNRLDHFAVGPEGHTRLFGLAISAADAHDDLAGAIGRFRNDVFLLDLAIYEGGVGEAYLDERSALLAEDEAVLVEQLLDEDRRLWEVMAVTPGEAMTLRDTGSGEELTFAEHRGSEGREPGGLILARAATVNGEPMLFGGLLEVPLRERGRVLRMLDEGADADMLAMWYGSLYLPPRLVNREGEAMVLRRTTIEIPGDVDAITLALDDNYVRRDDDLVWHETTVVDGGDEIIRGVLRLDGHELVVEANSEERQQRILATLEELFDYTVLDDETLDGPDLGGFHAADADDGDDDAGAGDSERRGLVGVDDVPDDVRKLVEQKIAEYERRWVDEAIPALAGLTPREALDDPTRREDLYALLREMRAQKTPEGAVGMSVDRVELLLGIDRT